jgi:hypothetical protein
MAFLKQGACLLLDDDPRLADGGRGELLASIFHESSEETETKQESNTSVFSILFTWTDLRRDEQDSLAT